MARKASTGDGSRLVRPNADSNDGTLDSAAASGPEVQQHDSADTGEHLQQHLLEEEEEFAGVVKGEGGAEGELLSNGIRVFNPVAPMTKPPHRLSRVTGGPCNCFCMRESRTSTMNFREQCIHHRLYLKFYRPSYHSNTMHHFHSGLVWSLFC